MSDRLQPSETGPWTPEPVQDPAYWKKRLSQADGELHRAMFAGSHGQFNEREIQQRRQILKAGIRPGDSILDVGCGWGRLITMMPPDWRGWYVGVDISPEFIQLARWFHPNRIFHCGNIRDGEIEVTYGAFDIAVVMWTKDMIIKNVNEATWDAIERRLETLAKRILIVE